MECRITRSLNITDRLDWVRLDNEGDEMTVYASRHCDDVIPLSMSSLSGFSGGCDIIDGVEVYRLTIASVTEDMGHFTWGCRFGSLLDDTKLDVKVMVTSATLQPPSSPIVAGSPSTFACVTSPSRPSACIRWFVERSGRDHEVTHGSPVCNQDSSETQRAFETLKFTAAAEVNGSSLYCTADNRVTNTPVRSKNYTLYVEYPPEVKVVVKNVGDIREGTTIEMECRVTEGNPQNYTLSSWTHHIGDRRIELSTSGTGRRLQISDAQFQDQGVYTCGASNGVGGVREGSREVKIKGTPKFPFPETKVHTDLDDVITLSAGFAAYPMYIKLYGVVDGGEEIIKRVRARKAMVDFTLYGTAVQVMGHEVELKITNPDRRDITNYTLRVENEMGTSKHVFIVLLKTEDLSRETQSQHLAYIIVPVVAVAVVVAFVVFVSKYTQCNVLSMARKLVYQNTEKKMTQMAVRPAGEANVDGNGEAEPFV